MDFGNWCLKRKKATEYLEIAPFAIVISFPYLTRRLSDSNQTGPYYPRRSGKGKDIFGLFRKNKFTL